MNRLRLRRLLPAALPRDRRELLGVLSHSFPVSPVVVSLSCDPPRPGEGEQPSGLPTRVDAAPHPSRSRPLLAIDLRTAPSAMEQRASGWSKA